MWPKIFTVCPITEKFTYPSLDPAIFHQARLCSQMRGCELSHTIIFRTI